MEITLDLKMLGITLIFIGLAILIIFCIVLVRNLIKTVKHTNQILEHTRVISGIASDRTKRIDGALDDVTNSFRSMSRSVKENRSTMNALTAVINAAASLGSLFKKNQKN